LNRPVHTISNGFDPFSSPEPEKPDSDFFSILYAGTINLRRQDPMGLLQGVQKCVSDGRIPPQLIKVHFLGASPDALRPLDHKKISDVPIFFEPRVTRRQALDRMARSTILWVLAHRGEKGVMTGKVFDYLSSGRPIISAPDDGGEINKLLDRTKAGFSLTDPNEIAEKLEEWFGQWQKNRYFQLNVNQNEVLKHGRERKTEELARVLDSLC
jgi:glycosyltransferase involved in cell wall biosynthesis